jgi:hypothetical protein
MRKPLLVLASGAAIREAYSPCPSKVPARRDKR